MIVCIAKSKEKAGFFPALPQKKLKDVKKKKKIVHDQPPTGRTVHKLNP